MVRNVKDDIYQIGEMVAGDNGYEAVNVYVILNQGRPILIDCGSHLYRANFMAQLDTVLGGAIPEFVFLTHSELPHSGNLQAIAEKWPEIKVRVSNVMLTYIEIAPVLPLGQITPSRPGTVLVVGDRELIFVDALLKDQPGSQWIYDSTTGSLFTGDGFGYYAATEEEKFSDELTDGISVAQFQAYHYNAFRFLRWVAPELLNVDVDLLFKRYKVQLLAPTHGSAIRADIPEHVARLKEAISNICIAYRNGEN